MYHEPCPMTHVMNKRVFFGGAILFVSLALTGFGCAPKDPETVIKKMPNAMVDIDSADYKVSFSGNPAIFDEEANSSLQQVAPGIDSINLELSGQFSREDQLLGESNGDFRISAEGEQGFAVAGDYIAKEESNFFQLTELSGTEQLGLPFDLSGVLNQWIITPKDPEAMMMLQDSMKEDEEELTEEQIEKIEDAFKDASLFSETADLGEEKIEGETTTKFKVVLDKAGILAFVAESSTISNDPMTEEDKVDLGQLIDRINSGDTYLWIGKDDNRLYQFEANPTELNGADVKQSAKIVVTIFNYNNASSVTAPEGAISLEEVMAQVMGGSAFGGLDLFGGSMDSMPRDGDMEFDDAKSFLNNLQGGDAVDPADLEAAFKALENL